MASFVPLPEAVVKAIFRQMLLALQYCHSKGVCHRDLRLENFLLAEDVLRSAEECTIDIKHKLLRNTVKLVDFGNCGIFAKGK